MNAIADLPGLHALPALPSLPPSPTRRQPSQHHQMNHHDHFIDAFFDQFCGDTEGELIPPHADPLAASTNISRGDQALIPSPRSQDHQHMHDSQITDVTDSHIIHLDNIGASSFSLFEDHCPERKLDKANDQRNIVIDSSSISLQDHSFRNCDHVMSNADDPHHQTHHSHTTSQLPLRHQQRSLNQAFSAVTSNASLVSSSPSMEALDIVSGPGDFSTPTTSENEFSTRNFDRYSISDIATPVSLSELNPCSSPIDLALHSSGQGNATELDIHGWPTAVSACSPASSEDSPITLPRQFTPETSTDGVATPDEQITTSRTTPNEVVLPSRSFSTKCRSAISATEALSFSEVVKITTQSCTPRRTRSSNDVASVSSPSVSPTIVKRHARRESALRISRFSQRWCHTCSRLCSSAPHLLCDNVLGLERSCKRFTCKSCFDEHGWDWQAAQADPTWLCTHCRGACPAVALCHVAGLLPSNELTNRHAHAKRRHRSERICTSSSGPSAVS